MSWARCAIPRAAPRSRGPAGSLEALDLSGPGPAPRLGERVHRAIRLPRRAAQQRGYAAVRSVEDIGAAVLERALPCAMCSSQLGAGARPWCRRCGSGGAGRSRTSHRSGGASSSRSSPATTRPSGRLRGSQRRVVARASAVRHPRQGDRARLRRDRDLGQGASCRTSRACRPSRTGPYVRRWARSRARSPNRTSPSKSAEEIWRAVNDP